MNSAPLTVEAHEVFRQSITAPTHPPFDELDMAASGETPAESILRLMDELAVEKLRSMSFEEKGSAL